MRFFVAQEVQAQPSAPAGGAGEAQQPGGGFGFLLPILLIWVVIWFVVLRPQKKQEKERAARVNSIQKGDKVRTRGGVIAQVIRVKDDEIVLGLAGDGRAEMIVHKTYIDEVYGEPKSDSKSESKDNGK